MIKTFEQFINETSWGGMIKRSNSQKEVRKEDGTRVHTCLGIDMILHNPDLEWEGMKYDDFIKELIESDDEYNPMRVDIAHSNELRLSPEEKANARNFETSYGYMIYDAPHASDLIASFNSYYDAIDSYNEQFPECVDEHDYIAICRCVATKLKEVGEHLELIPRDHSWILGSNNKPDGGGYALCLISESDTWNWECEQDEMDLGNYLERFKEEIIWEFPELENEDFIIWSYQYGYYIGLNITIDNLNNFQKYFDYTQKWFEA